MVLYTPNLVLVSHHVGQSKHSSAFLSSNTHRRKILENILLTSVLTRIFQHFIIYIRTSMHCIKLCICMGNIHNFPWLFRRLLLKKKHKDYVFFLLLNFKPQIMMINKQNLFLFLYAKHLFDEQCNTSRNHISV